MNNIKININNNSPKNTINENINNNKTNNNSGDKTTETEYNYNKSEKQLISEIKENMIFTNRKRFNTVKIESFKILDFFEKWKNAYLQLALKK